MLAGGPAGRLGETLFRTRRQRMLKKVLIVASDSTAREAVVGALGGHYQLSMVSSGDAALRQAKQVTPDLVVLDLRSATFDVLAVCRRLRGGVLPYRSHILALSGEPSGAEQMRILEAGADDYMAGPFSEQQLVSKVKLHLRLPDAVDSLAPSSAKVETYGSDLERLVAERTRVILQDQPVSLMTLTMLAESREIEDEDRVYRLRYYATIIAGELGRHGPYTDQVDVGFLENLYLAAPLHDIGKIGISEDILLKKGELTPQEREAMKEHTIIGAIFLEQIESRAGGNHVLDMAADIARWHHERFDGTGYPSRLSGEEIPLAARIVAVADTYDALTTTRPYQDPIPPEAAREIISREAGRQFDPVVVEAFQRGADDLYMMQTRLEDPFSYVPGAVSFLG